MSTEKGQKMTLKMSTGSNKIPLYFILRVLLILNLAGTDKVLSPGQLEILRKCVDIEHTCGYITVANLEMYPSISAAASTSETGQTNNEESFGSSSTTKSGISCCT